jgi:hypothetical protein
MEANSGIVFFVLLALSVASWCYFEPEPLFPLACLGGGAFAFLSNFKSAEGKTVLAFVFAVIGILLGVLFVPSGLGKSGVLLLSGSHLGLSLYGLIAIRKLVLAHRTGDQH